MANLRSGGLERFDRRSQKSLDDRNEFEDFVDGFERPNRGAFVFFLVVTAIVAGIALYARGPEVFGRLTGLMWFQYIGIALAMYNYIYGRE